MTRICCGDRWAGPPRGVARRITPLRVVRLSRYHSPVAVGFKPPPPERQSRLEHVRDLWQMHRPQRPHAILTAAIYEIDTGLELRVGSSLTNLIHSELSRKGDGPLEARAEDLRVSLLESGWIELVAPSTKQ
jgi:hypothetical protein